MMSELEISVLELELDHIGRIMTVHYLFFSPEQLSDKEISSQTLNAVTMGLLDFVLLSP